MKTKFKFLFVTCVIAAVAITGFNFVQNGSIIDVSLADIATMAKAAGENDPCPGWDGSAYCQWDDEYSDCVNQEDCNSSCPGGC